MRFNNDVKLEVLLSLIGKDAYYRTSRGRSLPQTIEAIELTANGVVLVLKRHHSAIVHRRRPDQVELIKPKKITDVGPVLPREKPQRCAKCHAIKKEDQAKCAYCNTIDAEFVKDALSAEDAIKSQTKI